MIGVAGDERVLGGDDGMVGAGGDGMVGGGDEVVGGGDEPRKICQGGLSIERVTPVI